MAVIVVANHPFKIPLCWWRRQEDVWVIYLHLLRYNLIEKIQPKTSKQFIYTFLYFVHYNLMEKQFIYSLKIQSNSFAIIYICYTIKQMKISWRFIGQGKTFPILFALFEHFIFLGEMVLVGWVDDL